MTPRAEMQTATAAAPIDGRALVERCMNDPAFAVMILNKFKVKMAGMVDAVAAAGTACDAAALSRAAHALKGAAGNLAATALADEARHLEEAAHGGDWTNVDGSIMRLRQLADEVVAYIPNLTATLQ